MTSGSVPLPHIKHSPSFQQVVFRPEVEPGLGSTIQCYWQQLAVAHISCTPLVLLTPALWKVLGVIWEEIEAGSSTAAAFCAWAIVLSCCCCCCGSNCGCNDDCSRKMVQFEYDCLSMSLDSRMLHQQHINTSSSTAPVTQKRDVVRQQLHAVICIYHQCLLNETRLACCDLTTSAGSFFRGWPWMKAACSSVLCCTGQTNLKYSIKQYFTAFRLCLFLVLWTPLEINIQKPIRTSDVSKRLAYLFLLIRLK